MFLINSLGGRKTKITNMQMEIGKKPKRLILSLIILFMLLSSGAYASVAPIVHAEKVSVQENALSTLSNVIGLDLSKYATTQTVEPADSYLGVLPQDNVRFTLNSNGSKVDILYTFVNSSFD